MKTKVGILSVVLLVSLSAQATAQRLNRQSCIYTISNLTEDQKAGIRQLDTDFQKQMADYRTQRQSTTNPDTKQTIREKMLTTRAEHQKSVNALLNPEQQKEYAAWQQTRQNNRNNKANRQGRGKGKGATAGNGQGQSRGGNGPGNGACIAIS